MQANTYKPRKAVYGGKWPTVRKRILQRDNHTCQIALPGCTITANTVDHITPVALGGSWYEPDNLRAACAHCNGELAKITQRITQQPSDSHTGANPVNVVPSRQW